MTKAQDEEWFKRYRLFKPLAQGGMGTVYLAEDIYNNNAQCVMKQLNTKSNDQDEQAEAVRLFKREVDLLRQLNHRGIVRFFDEYITTHDNPPKCFLVMDYVPGQDLELIISSFGPYNSEEVVKIGIQCCEVLEYLHDRKEPIIYRDLKPSNLMLRPDGQIVFIDFGIARTFMPKQSATRVVTAGYSPPEQYFGRPEIRSDLYALGATLCHLITGQRPKPLAANSPRLLRPEMNVNHSLDLLVRRLTAHNPSDRPASAREVRYELYHIYQEMHPEFCIPNEALPEQLTVPTQNRMKDDDAKRAGRSAKQNEVSSGQGSSTNNGKGYSLKELQKLTSKDKSGRTNLWQWLKQWWQLVSNRQ